ncbi:MAG: hypothetical protein P8Z00_07425 [Anaerolineales bacterium]
MNYGEIVIGQRQRWLLKKKLGEGDAGEVHLVESLLDQKPAILKRPYSNGNASQVLRQATQIIREAQILKSLSGLTFPVEAYQIHTPALLDQSQSGSEYSGGLFIVIEIASGTDLKALARLTRYGQAVEDNNAGDVGSGIPIKYYDQMLREGEIPDLMMLRA